jgi:hypothetical protein
MTHGNPHRCTCYKYNTWVCNATFIDEVSLKTFSARDDETKACVLNLLSVLKSVLRKCHLCGNCKLLLPIFTLTREYILQPLEEL